jgi:hypothetical protein
MHKLSLKLDISMGEGTFDSLGATYRDDMGLSVGANALVSYMHFPFLSVFFFVID